MTTPPDRSHVATEARHPRSADFDALPIGAQVELLVDDHAQAIEAVRGAAPAIARLLEELVPRVAAGGRLVYIGAGTSGRLGVLDASECPPTFRSDPGQVVGVIAGGDGALRRSSEGREDEFDGAFAELERLGFAAADTLVGLAAGGTTPYVLGALREASRRGGRTALVTCAPGAAARAGAVCDHLVELATGPEILTGSTRLKAGTATKLLLNTLTTVLFTRLGAVHGNLMVDLAATNDKLLDRAIRTLRHVDPTLDRELAHALVLAAGGRVKTAILMRLAGLDREGAEARLLAARGRLRDALASVR